VFSVRSVTRCYKREKLGTAVEYSEVKSWLVTLLVRELQFSRCELLLLEAGS
jgi:hypothetical protein